MDLDQLTLGEIKQLKKLLCSDETKDSISNNTTIPTFRAVLVCTEYRGVFFGYAADTSGDVIHLKNARNCIYWDSSTGGFIGLAETGPGKNCRIGERADMELRKITCVVEVTEAATKAWEDAKVYRG